MMYRISELVVPSISRNPFANPNAVLCMYFLIAQNVASIYRDLYAFNLDNSHANFISQVGEPGLRLAGCSTLVEDPEAAGTADSWAAGHSPDTAAVEEEDKSPDFGRFAGSCRFSSC